MSISSTIKSIQDIMRKDDGINGDAQRIGQLVWMLFLKVFDQREEEWEDDAEDRGEEYQSPLPYECRWRNWAAYKDGKPQMGSDDLLDFVNNDLFPTLKELKVQDDPKAKVVREVFRDAYNYMKSGTSLLAVIEKIEDAINFHDFTTRQNIGDIYEQILKDLQSAGNAGEFYTPRAVTQFMVQQTNPDFGEKVIDPACGTGGFLTATIDHLNSKLDENSDLEDKLSIQNAINGIEKKQLPHLLCTTNMLLHGIDVPSQIEHKNTLAKEWNGWSKSDQVDVVVTNPPFGGLEDAGVGSSYPADIKTRETADMFLALIIKKLLKDGGRSAVVLPDGTLFGEGVKNKIKEMWLEECNLHTIIRLPNGVFNPYTGIKTNLLFFTKGQPTETIWFYEHPYPEGYKNYSKTKPIQLKEFDAEKAWWGDEADGFASRQESELAWKVDFKVKKEEAVAKAKPHWDKADSLKEEARTLKQQNQILTEQMRDLRNQLKKEKDVQRRAEIDEETRQLLTKSGELTALQLEAEQKAKDEQAAGDRLYWPIYNLDIKNPNAPEEETHDPDDLLGQYKALLHQIEATEQLLADELDSALSHHISNVDGEGAAEEVDNG